MRIVDIRETAVPISSPIRNAFIDFTRMDVSVVAVITDVMLDGAPAIGFGFNSNGRYAPSCLLRERFIPRILAAQPATLLDPAGRLDPALVWACAMANEKPGGHGERSVAVGTIDMAIWDLLAKIEGKPLYRLTSERFRGDIVDDRVFVYAAGGYYEPGKGLHALQEEMRAYLDLGYTVVKMKIGGVSLDDDRRRVEAVLAVVGDGQALAVDANGRFDRATALAYAEMLAPYDLRWYEEPVDPLDFEALADVANAYPGPLATGENLFSMPDARNLIRYGGLRSDRDILQFDCALSYGLVEYLRTLEVAAGLGWSWRSVIPHGGHQMSLSIAAGLGLGGNESYPGVFAPFGGFADGIPVEGGFVRLPDIPGIGIEAKSELYALMRRTLLA